jgi:hypothetical protein
MLGPWSFALRVPDVWLLLLYKEMNPVAERVGCAARALRKKSEGTASIPR